MTGCGDTGTEPEAETEEVASITISASRTVIEIGGSAQLEAAPRSVTGTVLSGRNISFTSSAQGVASVDPEGTVEGLRGGTTTITARSEGRSASIEIVVAPIEVDVVHTLEYGELSELQTLDLYLPKGEGPFPVVVYVHGGGLSRGDKTDIYKLSWQTFPAQGFALASVNHRLVVGAAANLFPAQIHDVKGAIAFLRGNGDRFGIDTTRIGAWGPSSGGMLAGLLALSEDEPTLRGPLHTEYGSGVEAAVLWFPMTDLSTYVPQMEAKGCDVDWVPLSIESWLGRGSMADDEKMAWPSPITYVSAAAPPILMQHGTADCTVPPAQSTALGEALREAGAPDVTVDLVEGGGHGIDRTIFSSPAMMEPVVEFFVRTLGP